MTDQSRMRRRLAGVVIGTATLLVATAAVAYAAPPPSLPQNANGYEGHGYRIYLNRAYDGPGTYTMTLQKVGPGVSADYPNGTTVVDANGLKRAPSNGNDKQVVTVLPALAADPEPEPAPEPVVPVVPEQPAAPADAVPAQGQATPDLSYTSEVLAADTTTPNSVPLAATGYDEGSSVLVPIALWTTVAGAAIGTAALVGTRRARA